VLFVVYAVRCQEHKVSPYSYNESMIPKDLLDILVCPACKQNLALSGNGERLKCSACRRVYPIRDNIPILLIDEAVIDPA
jgi:uncharacterized protein YbaR (Trm112 family)